MVLLLDGIALPHLTSHCSASLYVKLHCFASSCLDWHLHCFGLHLRCFGYCNALDSMLWIASPGIVVFWIASCLGLHRLELHCHELCCFERTDAIAVALVCIEVAECLQKFGKAIIAEL